MGGIDWAELLADAATPGGKAGSDAGGCRHRRRSSQPSRLGDLRVHCLIVHVAEHLQQGPAV